MNQTDQRGSRSVRQDLPRGRREAVAAAGGRQPTWRASEKSGTRPVDLLCSRNAPGFVCLVGWSFWSVWFFLMNFRSDQPDQPDRRDRPDEPAFVGRAQWKINQPPPLRDNERAWREHLFRSMRALEDQPGYPVEEEVLDSFQTRQLSSPNLGTRCLSFMPMIFNCPSCSHSWIQFFRSLFQVRGNVIAEDHASS